MKPNPLFSLLSVSLLVLSACETKNFEADPDVNVISGMTLEERVQLSREIDQRLAAVGRGLNGLRRVSTKVEELTQNADKQALANYSVLDLMVDLNEGLREEFPSSNGRSNRIEKTKVLNLPAWSVEAGCQSVEVKGIFEVDQTLKIASMVYSIKSCETEGQFVDVANVSFLESRFVLKVDTQNLNQALANPFLRKLKNRFECEAKVQGSVVDSIECKGVKVALQGNDLLNFKTLKYSRVDEQRFVSDADLMDGEVLKATAALIVFADGRVDFRFDPTEQESVVGQ